MTENIQKKYHFAKVLLPKLNDTYLCSSNFKKSEVQDVYECPLRFYKKVIFRRMRQNENTLSKDLFYQICKLKQRM